MSESLKLKKIYHKNMRKAAGANSKTKPDLLLVKLTSDSRCVKPSHFKVCKSSEKAWSENGFPKVCKCCYNFKYDSDKGFYCDV